jgi:uncharacterized delta-60 repeat protein
MLRSSSFFALATRFCLVTWIILGFSSLPASAANAPRPATASGTVRIAHDLPHFFNLDPYWEYYVLHDSATPLRFDITNSTLSDTTATWQVVSGPGQASPAQGESTQFLSGSGKGDSIIRATSVQDPNLYAELTLHTAATISFSHPPRVDMVAGRLQYIGGYILVDDKGSRNIEDTLTNVQIELVGPGTIYRNKQYALMYQAPTVAGETLLRFRAAAAPQYVEEVPITIREGGPHNCEWTNAYPGTETIYTGSGSTNLPSYPDITGFRWTTARVGENLVVSASYNLTAPADDPIEGVTVRVFADWEPYGPYPMMLVSGTPFAGTWQAQIPNIGSNCPLQKLIFSAGNSAHTAVHEHVTPEGGFSLGRDNWMDDWIIGPLGGLGINAISGGETSLSASPLFRTTGSAVELVSDFAPGAGANSGVWAVAVQPDGKAVIAGEFTRFAEVATNRVARLTPEGVLDPTFTADVDFSVTSLVLQPDGKVVIGGWFTQVDGIPARGIARLNADGSLDASFNPGAGFDYGVQALAMQPDGKILVSGRFTQYDGIAANGLVRLNADGSRDVGFAIGLGFDDVVSTLVLQPDGKILAGGRFWRFDGQPSKYLARLLPDGRRDSNFTSMALNGRVGALALQADGKILIGGEFRAQRWFIARLLPDGAMDDGFYPSNGPDATVRAILPLADGRTMIGGFFTRLGGYQGMHLAMLDNAGGAMLSYGLGTESFGFVRTFAALPGYSALAAGDFSEVNGQLSRGIARITTALAPQFTQASPPPGVVGYVYAYHVAADAFPAAGYSISSGSLPPGLALEPVSGMISGTPTQEGTFTSTVSASNGVSADATTQLTIEILAPTTVTILPETGTQAENGRPVRVVFQVGATQGRVRVSAGVAQACEADLPANACELTFQDPGPVILTAEYLGSAPKGMSAPYNLTVNKSQLSLTFSQTTEDKTPYGRSFSTEVTLSEDNPNINPDGTIVVTAGSQTCLRQLDGSTHNVECIFMSEKPGIYSISARYSGGDHFLPVSAPPIQHTVTRMPVTVTLYSPSPTVDVSPGMPVFLSASVAAAGSLITPTGTVEIGGQDGCAFDIRQASGCWATSTVIGDWNLKATYSGDDWYMPSESLSITLRVSSKLTVFLPVLFR